MVWTEARSGVKFLCWGTKKESLTDEQAFIVPMGKPIEAVVDKVEIVKDDDDEIENYKLWLNIEEFEEPVLMWSNSSLKRQIEDLNLKEGEKIQVTYIKDYKARNNKIGKDIRLLVDRPVDVTTGTTRSNGKKRKK